MGRYASREDDIDRMLRAKLFVDLYQVVRHAVRASVESYSIKQLEPFCGYERQTPLADANVALANLQASLDLGHAAGIPMTARKWFFPITGTTAAPLRGCETGWKCCASNSSQAALPYLAPNPATAHRTKRSATGSL